MWGYFKISSNYDINGEYYSRVTISSMWATMLFISHRGIIEVSHNYDYTHLYTDNYNGLHTKIMA